MTMNILAGLNQKLAPVVLKIWLSPGEAKILAGFGAYIQRLAYSISYGKTLYL